ncbi:hypothetical protein T02_12467 [Trichinella nativa]|uniref:Uncharacterized protein n=1 Tax=Trichinella nativa TaxID=6335 RepID=A0A0V1KJ77_9BILA|nr:hypothetical protein T02_12467 [Trichinella nativa]
MTEIQIILILGKFKLIAEDLIMKPTSVILK